MAIGVEDEAENGQVEENTFGDEADGMRNDGAQNNRIQIGRM